MSEINMACAEALLKNRKAIATVACQHLLTHNPHMAARFGEDSPDHWTDHLFDRVTELAESVAAGEPKIFSAHVQWAKKAMAARSLGEAHLTATLESLRISVETMTPKDLLGPVIDCIEKALALDETAAAQTWDSALDPRHQHDSVVLHYIQTVISGNVWLGMQIVLDAVEEGITLRDIFTRVLIPAQVEVGRLWHMNEVSVAEEHLVTSTTQRLMSVLAHQAPRKPDRGHTVIAASVAGNSHDLGIRTIAYLLEFEGWRTIFLGADMPRAELPAAIKFYDADVVMLSIALSTQLGTLKRTVSDIREVCGPQVKIMLGGYGLNGVPDLWRDIGGDGYAEGIEDALVLAAELAAKP